MYPKALAFSKEDQIENLICQRVKQYIQESGTLERIIDTALKHRLTGLPLLDEEIRETRIGQMGTITIIPGRRSSARSCSSKLPMT